MKEFINDYYRLFCSKYAEDICRFVNGYDFREPGGEFSDFYEYSESSARMANHYWRKNKSSKFTMSEIWVAIQDLFYVMGYDFKDVFQNIIISLCDDKAKHETAKLAMTECEPIFKHVVYKHFCLPENPQNGKLTLGTVSYALGDFLLEHSSGYHFYWSVAILANARNLACHETTPKPLNDSDIFRLRILRYIISVVVGIVAILNKYKPAVETFSPIREPLKVKIMTVASEDVTITDVAWGQDESDKMSIGKIEGAEIREFEIKIQRHKPIFFDIKYAHNGETKTASYSPSLDFNDNADYVLEICIPNAKYNCRFKKIDIVIPKDGKYKEIADSQVPYILSEETSLLSCTDFTDDNDKSRDVNLYKHYKQYEDGSLFFERDDFIEEGTLEVSGKLLKLSCMLKEGDRDDFGITLFWQCEIIEVEEITSEGWESMMSGSDSSLLDLSNLSLCTNLLTSINNDRIRARLNLSSSQAIFHQFNIWGVKESTFIHQDFEEIKLPPCFFVQPSAFAENRCLKRLYCAHMDLIGPSAFQNCVSLQRVYNDKPDDIVTVCRQAFKNCVNLRAIEISSNPGEEAFSGCTKLRSVKFNNRLIDQLHGTIEKITELPKGVFYGCEALESIEIPDTVVKIGSRAFYGCALKSVTIPRSVKVICEEAFAECSFLEEICFEDISTLKEIHTKAFVGCNLQYIYAGLDHVGNVAKLSIREFSDKYSSKLTESDIFDDTPKYDRLISNIKKTFVNALSSSEE